MKIEIIVDPARPPTLSQRVAPASAVVAATVPTIVATTNGTRSGRPRGGRRTGRRGKKTGERPVKSAADLDAEMEDYSKATNEAAPVTTV